MRRLLLIPVLLAVLGVPSAIAASVGGIPDRVLGSGCSFEDPSTVARTSDSDNVPLTEKTIVSPTLIRVDVDPGTTFTCPITIRNRHKAKSTTFTLTSSGITGSHDPNTSVHFIDRNDPAAAKTAASWIEPVEDSITLPPLGVATVPVVVTVPKDAAPGGAYASFDVIPESATATGDTNVTVEGRVVVPFLLRVGGKGTPKLSLHDVHAPKLRWNRESWTLEAKLDNDGTLHATPTGRVRVRSLFGNTVADLHVDGRPLLPGGRQPVIETWRGVPWLGFYRYDLRLADAAPSSDDSGVTRASGWFIALPPWWVMALAALVLVYAVAGPIVHRRRRARRWEADHDDSETGDSPDQYLD